MPLLFIFKDCIIGYESFGKKSAKRINRINKTIWKINVYATDDYDFKNEHNSRWLVDYLNDFGNTMQEWGVMEKYVWEINYDTYYFDKND